MLQKQPTYLKWQHHRQNQWQFKGNPNFYDIRRKSMLLFYTLKSDYFDVIPKEDKIAENNNITISWNSTKEILAIMEEKQEYVIEIKYFLKEVFL